MRYSQRGHGHSLPVEHYRRFCFRHIDDADIETNASPRLALRATQRGTEHLKGAILLIEEATEEHGKAWRHVVTGRAGYGQRVLASLMAQPQEGGQIRDVVGMKMAYGDQRQVAKLCLGLAEAKEGAAAHVDKHPRLSADPKRDNRLTRDLD